MIGANAIRGEAALMLAGGSVVLRPTFARLCAAEAELGSLLALAERAGEGDLRVSEMVALLWHCLDAPFEREAFGEAALAAGVARLAPAVHALFRQVMAGA